MEQSLIDFVNEIYANYPLSAYFFFFISAALQILFPPYPGDTVLVLEGFLSSKGYFSTTGIILNAITATFLSCLLLYHISLKAGDRIFENAFIKKFFPGEKVQRLTGWFKKYGAIAILLSKFVPGIGSLIIIVAGTFKVPRLKAYAAMGIAAIIHNCILLFAGNAAGYNMDLLKELFRKYYIALIILAIICIVCYTAVKYCQKSRMHRKGA